MERALHESYKYRLTDGLDDDWFCDIMRTIDEGNETLEAWIYTRSCGVKLFMFGVNADDCGITEFERMVENLWTDYTTEYANRFLGGAYR